MDVEPGDATPAQSGTYVQMRHAAGIARPIIYASASNINDCRRSLDSVGLARASYRLLSAHYGKGEHICGNPGTNCGYNIDVDGTQWIDHNNDWDETLLRDNFLDGGGPPPVPPPGPIVPPYPGYPLYCPPVRQTAMASQWQLRMQQRGWHIVVDGWYGPASRTICIQFQQQKGARVDGIVGPTTWNLTWTSPVT
jgi:peptidoglycan hydrolase-like protein with peptidoglycan-binding domain